MSQTIEAPSLHGNAALFNSVFKLVSDQAQIDQQPCEVILAQVIYHASYELFYSDMPLGHVQGVVEAAALTVAKEYEEAESLGAGGAA
jgi:hypothetical protein